MQYQFNETIFFHKPDFFLAALFLCMRPIEAILSITETAVLYSSLAFSVSFSSTAKITLLIWAFSIPFLLRLIIVLDLSCLTLFFADSCCGIMNSYGKYNIMMMSLFC